jgi:hypothetical protein
MPRRRCGARARRRLNARRLHDATGSASRTRSKAPGVGTSAGASASRDRHLRRRNSVLATRRRSRNIHCAQQHNDAPSPAARRHACTKRSRRMAAPVTVSQDRRRRRISYRRVRR